MTTIATVTLPDEAHLLRMRLGSCGIEAFVQNENFIQMDPFYSNAIGGVRVEVADEDAEAARELLAADEGVPEAEDVAHCPQCGATTIELERFSRRFAYFSLLFLGLPLLLLHRRFRCNTCLHTWKP